MFLRLTVLLAALLCLLFFATSQAKCPWALIHIRGNIDGKAPADLRFNFSVESSTPGDSQKKLKQESAIHDSHFEATLYFDTFESMRNGTHVCARKPRVVTLSLVSATQTISQKVLTIQNDFRRTEEGDYEILQPLVVQIASGEN
jgi:hypothetical protein